VDGAARDTDVVRELLEAELLFRAVVTVEQTPPEQRVDLLVQALPLDPCPLSDRDP
jgi:hypothetical protein